MIDIVSEYISSLFYNKEKQYEDWSNLEVYLRFFIHFILPLLILIPVSLHTSTVVELICIGVFINLFNRFLHTTFHASTLDKCQIITIISISLVLFASQYTINYIEIMILSTIFTSAIVSSSLNRKCNVGVVKQFDSVVRYFLAYNLTLIIMIWSYLLGFKSIVNGIAWANITVNLFTYNKMVVLLRKIDDKLGKSVF